MRFGNGYKSFFMSMKYDFCKYMRNPNERSLTFLKEIHSTFIDATNLNHTCPYNVSIYFNFGFLINYCQFSIIFQLPSFGLAIWKRRSCDIFPYPTEIMHCFRRGTFRIFLVYLSIFTLK